MQMKKKHYADLFAYMLIAMFLVSIVPVNILVAEDRTGIGDLSELEIPLSEPNPSANVIRDVIKEGANAKTMEEAIGIYEKFGEDYLIQVSPDMMNRLGILYTRMGRYDEARQILEEALRVLRIDSSNNGLLNLIKVSIANLDIITGDFDAAENRLRRVIAQPATEELRLPFSIAPQLFEAPFFLAKLYQEKGMISEAEQLLKSTSEEAVTMAKDNPDVIWLSSYVANAYKRRVSLSLAANPEDMNSVDEIAEELKVNLEPIYGKDEPFSICPTLSGPSYEDDQNSDFGTTVLEVTEECKTCNPYVSLFNPVVVMMSSSSSCSECETWEGSPVCECVDNCDGVDCVTCKECNCDGDCVFTEDNECSPDESGGCGTGESCQGCRCECDISQCGDEGECVSGEYDFSEYLSGAQTALNSAITAIPCVTGNLALGGTLSGDVCPCCPCSSPPECACIDIGTASASGKATCTGDLTGSLPSLSWGFSFEYSGNSVWGGFTFGPTLAIEDIDAEATIDVFKRLNSECGDVDTCIEWGGDVSATATGALTADIEAGIDLNGWWDADLNIQATASVSGSASACVEYGTDGCPGPNDKADAVLGDVTGVIKVFIDLCWPIPNVHWTSPTHTFYDGSDVPANCTAS